MDTHHSCYRSRNGPSPDNHLWRHSRIFGALIGLVGAGKATALPSLKMTGLWASRTQRCLGNQRSIKAQNSSNSISCGVMGSSAQTTSARLRSKEAGYPIS